MAIGATGSAGRFEIARRSTYASHAEAYKKKVGQQQATAFANAANTMFGAIVTHSAGLFEIAVTRATNRTQAEIIAKVADVTA